MCVKFSPRDLNTLILASHTPQILICGVTIAPRVCGGKKVHLLTKFISIFLWKLCFKCY